ncbi:hypothetical protein [Rhizobium sp. H4]|uniref:hypothetical protein n=1 Tax=Rhizobium sp. H4 TaxID=2035449 RepID=UPI000D0EA40B|nr:hypothetical protein [Rhizobium sp. H4]
MATLTGTSKQMEDQARELTDSELAEIAYMNDSPQALKARGEIARRAKRDSDRMLCWAKIAGVFSIIAVVLAVLTAIIPWMTSRA